MVWSLKLLADNSSSVPSDPAYCTRGCQGTAVPDSPLLLAGTRIIYDHKFLLECKNSPGARILPCCLPQIPGVTSLAQSSLVKLEELKEQNETWQWHGMGNAAITASCSAASVLQEWNHFPRQACMACNPQLRQLQPHATALYLEKGGWGQISAVY
uniref:Uncharacterized protein n=1 Tax=Pavo cristatus TaxID=9049 RepID=A0A8C9ETH5_PAVCR